MCLSLRKGGQVSTACSAGCFLRMLCAVWCLLQLNRSIDRSVNSTFLVTGWVFCQSLSILSPTESEHCHKSHWQFSYNRLLAMSSWPQLQPVVLYCKQLSNWKFFNSYRPCSHLPQALILKTFLQGAHLYLGKGSVGMSGITHLNKISDTCNWS